MKNLLISLTLNLCLSQSMHCELKVYRVNPNPPAGVVAMPEHASQLPPAARSKARQPEIPSYRLTAPSDWTALTPKPMQLERLSLDAQGATVSLAAFQGDTGGLLSNVNRWRQQLDLPPITEAALTEPMVSERVLEERTFTRVRLQNTSKGFDIYVYFDGEFSWFFKLEAPIESLDHYSEAFNSWVFSFREETGSLPKN